MTRYVINVVILILFVILGCGKMVRAPEVSIYEISPDVLQVTSTTAGITVTIKIANDVDAKFLKAEFYFLKVNGSAISGVNALTRYFDQTISGNAMSTVLNSYEVSTVEIYNYMINNPSENIIFKVKISGEDAYGYEKTWNCEGTISCSVEQP